ncbi:hypothetical protein WMY93_019134 [Mugilogobius chulae]|uniref:C2H2-type domain-containing protein n=1 Tax=Mugilogobius chulae TaxID=88201 RepID=A0AAW0NKA8_9GOBI
MSPPSVPPLGFRLNGRLIPLLPGMEGFEVSVRSHPPGSKSSLTSLHLREAPPSSRRYVKRKAPPSKETDPPPKRQAPPPSSVSPAPVTASASVTPHQPRTTPTETAKLRPHVTSPKSQTPPTQAAKPRPRMTSPKPSVPTLLHKELIPAPPPDCPDCGSSFKALCSSQISSSLESLQWKRKEERLKSKMKKLTVMKQQQLKVSKPLTFHSTAAANIKSVSSLQKPLKRPSYFLSEPRPPVSRPRPSVTPSTYRPRPSVSPAAVSRPRPSPSPSPRPRPSPSPRPCSSSGPAPSADRCSSSGVSVGGAVGRLVIRLEDFYYGSSEGHAVPQTRVMQTYRCIHCPEKLHNNVSLMQHLNDNTTSAADFSCCFCHRQIVPLFRLQRHLKAVHGPRGSSSTVVCQICEFEFETEIALLLHMKNTHKPGEMPYACEVVDFAPRSSLRPGNISRKFTPTQNTLCVTRSRSTAVVMQTPLPDVQRASDHQLLFHGTHVRPAQLSGLRPGTTVTVRNVPGGFFRLFSDANEALPTPSVSVQRVQKKASPDPQSLCRVFVPLPGLSDTLSLQSVVFSLQISDVLLQSLRQPHDQQRRGGAEHEEEVGVASGGFVPIDLMQSSSHLSIKVLNRPAALSSPVAMTITCDRPRPPPKGNSAYQEYVSLPQGDCGWSIWTVIAEEGLGQSQVEVDTMGGARWVLTEREQNRVVKPDAILDLSQRVLGAKTPLQTRLNWSVDFLLRHDLGLDSRSREMRDTGNSLVICTWNKV